VKVGLEIVLHTDFQTSCALAFAHLSPAPVVLVVFDIGEWPGGGGAPLPAALSHVVLVADAAHHMTNRWAPDGACAQQDPPLDAGDNNDVQQKTMWDCGTYTFCWAGVGGDQRTNKGYAQYKNG